MVIALLASSMIRGAEVGHSLFFTFSVTDDVTK